MEKAKDAKDVKEPSDTAAAAPGGGGGGGNNEGSTKDASGGGGGNVRAQQQHKTARDKDASSLSAQEHQHHDDDGGDDDRPVNEFEIEIHEGEDAKGLMNILRAAGYDVEVAELGNDGKYTIQSFDEDDYAETETTDEKGKKRKHSGNGHDEL